LPRGLIASLLLGRSSEWNKLIASQTSSRSDSAPRRSAAEPNCTTS